MNNKTLIAFTVCFLLASPVMAQDVNSNQLRKTQNSQKTLDRKVKRALAGVAIASNVGFMPNIFSKAISVVFVGTKATITIEKDMPELVTAGSKVKIYNGRNEEAQVIVTNVNGNSFTVEGLNQSAFGDNLFVFGKEVSDFKPVDYNAMSIINAAENQALKVELDLLKKKLRSTEFLTDDLRSQQIQLREIREKLEQSINQSADQKPKSVK